MSLRDYMYYGLPTSTLVHKFANIATTSLKCGKNCRIDAFVTITGDVTLGNRVHIGTGACLFGTHGITIGDGASISPGAKIFSASEDVTSDLVSNPQVENRYTLNGAVDIGRLAVIGANSVVLPGAFISDESVVGALSLVKGGQWIGHRDIVVGVPSRYIRARTRVNKQMTFGGKL